MQRRDVSLFMHYPTSQAIVAFLHEEEEVSSARPKELFLPHFSPASEEGVSQMRLFKQTAASKLPTNIKVLYLTILIEI